MANPLYKEVSSIGNPRAKLAQSPPVSGPYIVSAWYDSIFFIFSPLLALAIGFLVIRLRLYNYDLTSYDSTDRVTRIMAWPAFFSLSFTHAHLFIVFFRSHGNPKIFQQYRFRFTWVPILLLLSALVSQWVFVTMSVLITWWDVYHSSLQTFGLGRIYDQRAGNDLTRGRTLDIIFNLTVYAGPVLAGVYLWNHLSDFQKFMRVDSLFLASLAERIFSRYLELRYAVLTVGLCFIIYYLYSYFRLYRQGYRIPLPKLLLFLNTALVSITCWGFGSIGEAFFVMNFFHAFQYFAIVWWAEKNSMISIFHLTQIKARIPIALVLFLCIGFGYGMFRWYRPHDLRVILALSYTVSILHFWYDGFIWSVRKKQV